METKNEKDFWFHLVRRGLSDTSEYLEIRKKILEYNPDAVVVIDAFSKKDYDQLDILSGLAADAPFKYVYFSYRSKFNVPDEAVVLNSIGALKEELVEFEKIFTVAPYTLHHLIFEDAVIEGKKHPAYNENGELIQDARWIMGKDNRNLGDYDSMLQNAIGYAMPYPDVSGSGADVVSQLEAVATGMDYFVDAPYAEEKVENALRLVENDSRCHKNTFNGFVEVYAVGFGWFHSGTLMAVIKERWPEAKWVVIRNDRGKITKKTGKTQYSVASLSMDEDLREKVKDLPGEKIIMSPVYVHLSRDAFDELKLKA